MRLEIDENGAVTLPFALCPIVHAERPDRPAFRQRCRPHQPQQGALTDGHPLCARVAGTGSAAQGEARAFQMGTQPDGAPCGGGDQGGDALGEDLPLAPPHATDEAPGVEMDDDGSATAGQVGDGTRIVTVDALGAPTAERTPSSATRRDDVDMDDIAVMPEPINPHAGDARKQETSEHRDRGLSPVGTRTGASAYRCRCRIKSAQEPTMS